VDAIADRVRGLVFGAALGDSIGLATEFMTREEINEKYPADHIFRPGVDVYPDTHRMNFPRGDWTDDTDQLLLMLQTLLEHGGMYNGPTFASKLGQWKKNGFSELGDQGGAGLGYTTKTVMQHQFFLSDPQRASKAVWERGGRKAAPNGGVMRAAITAIPFFWDASIVEENTVNFCKSTHSDPRCVASCIAVAECARILIGGSAQVAESGGPKESLDANSILDCAMIRAKAYLSNNSGDGSAAFLTEFHRYATAASLEELELDAPSSIGYTFKCMGTGLWALGELDKLLLPSDDNDLNKKGPTLNPRAKTKHGSTFFAKFQRKRMPARQGSDGSAGLIGSLRGNEQHKNHCREAVENILQAIVRAGGDADTNATVAGALLGARVGYSGLPIDWIMELPYVVWLEAWIQKLLFMLQLPTTIDSAWCAPQYDRI
jgi:ADP-ribosylglycohydrolase